MCPHRVADSEKLDDALHIASGSRVETNAPIGVYRQLKLMLKANVRELLVCILETINLPTMRQK